MSGFFKELFRTQIYKRRQGRVTRQVTFAALAIGMVLGIWQVAGLMQGWGDDIASLVHTEPTTTYSFSANHEEVLAPLWEEMHGGQKLIVQALQAEGGPVEQGELLKKSTSTDKHLDDLKESGIVKPDYSGEKGKAFASFLSVLFMLVPFACMAVGIWISFRIVNVHAFADFLIAVEAEMKKVSWPDSPTLMRSTIVVLVTIFFLAAILYAFDFVWRTIFTYVLPVL